MKPKQRERKPTGMSQLADPKTILRAANAAPHIFNIAEYFRPLYVMREKGYSWRFLSNWLVGFGIEVSHVHLHRLYVKEDARLSRLTEQELLALGMPIEMIAEREAKEDPTKRLIAPDPEDEAGEDLS